MATAREYLRNWLRWQRGRQGTGYDKLPNIILKRPRSGGEFICANPIFETKRIKLFRSDVSMHSVTKVHGGSRYVLSLGWVLKGTTGV